MVQVIAEIKGSPAKMLKDIQMSARKAHVRNNSLRLCSFAYWDRAVCFRVPTAGAASGGGVGRAGSTLTTRPRSRTEGTPPR